MTALDYMVEHFGSVARPGRFELEPVVAQILAGAIHLVTVKAGGDYQGFALISGRDRKLWVHAMFLETPGHLDALCETLLSMARQAGLAGIAFETTRKGWERRLSRYGAKPIGTIYEAPL